MLKSRRIQIHFSPNVDDIVLIKDDIPRGCWKVGRMVSLVFSLDGCVRSAKVALSSERVIARPLNLFLFQSKYARTPAKVVKTVSNSRQYRQNMNRRT